MILVSQRVSSFNLIKRCTINKPKLISLLPSTDVDLTRWILAHYQIDYKEYPHAPIFHVFALKYHGENGKIYPLLFKDDQKLLGFNKIFATLEKEAPDHLKLLPSDNDKLKGKINKAQHDLRYGPGTDVVNWSYWNLLKYKSVVWTSVSTDVPWFEKAFYHIAFPLIRIAMYKGLKLNQLRADEDLQNVYNTWNELDALLADGRSYLMGDQLTIYDIATAATLAPMILAQGYHGMLPNQAKCPIDMQKIYTELRARPTGQFIQRIYDIQCENSHLHFQRRERAMNRFRGIGSLQKFTSVHSQFYNHFQHQRHIEHRRAFKNLRNQSLADWREICV